MDSKKAEKHKKRKKNPKKKKNSPNNSNNVLKNENTKPSGPFSQVVIEKRVKSEIKDAPYKNALQILNVVRSSQNHEDLILKLKALDFDVELKVVEKGFAGLNAADEVWQLRINEQYRVLIPMVKFIERTYPASENTNDNDNNAAPIDETVTWKIYQDKIYIDDPHKG